MTKHYDKYFIGQTDQFDPANYSYVNDEIDIINKKTDTLPFYFKVEIIISFLKNHSLQNNWVEANPELTELVTSQKVFTGSIESLFDSCRNNPSFRQGLETYLKKRFTGHIELKAV